MNETTPPAPLVKSRQRVADHGEVFTPPDLVEAMLDLVKSESERIEARFLEPACGSGNFLTPVLRRKLATVRARYGASDFEFVHMSLLALMSIYGVELLPDNVKECRANLLEVFATELDLEVDEAAYKAAETVLQVNIVHGDALAMATVAKAPESIVFAEWSYLGKGKFQRRDFRLSSLTNTASFNEPGTLFADAGAHELFTPEKDFGSLSVSDLAGNQRS
jgi:hypothetical protein